MITMDWITKFLNNNFKIMKSLAVKHYQLNRNVQVKDILKNNKIFYPN